MAYNQNNVEVGDYIKFAEHDEFMKVDAVTEYGAECHDDGHWYETTAAFYEIIELRLRDEVPGTNFD